jgi:hypothetical protein
LVYITSHGNRSKGIALEGHGYLGIDEFRRILDGTIGNLPAVLLLSACFAGQFLQDPGLRNDHRILLAAARQDRSSFGCGSGSSMPEWDDSLTRLLTMTSAYPDWPSLASGIEADIARKEAGMEDGKHSLPQSWFGQLAHCDGLLPIPGRSLQLFSIVATPVTRR